jgi:hypothetical protein
MGPPRLGLIVRAYSPFISVRTVLLYPDSGFQKREIVETLFTYWSGTGSTLLLLFTYWISRQCDFSDFYCTSLNGFPFMSWF